MNRWGRWIVGAAGALCFSATADAGSEPDSKYTITSFTAASGDELSPYETEYCKGTFSISSDKSYYLDGVTVKGKVAGSHPTYFKLKDPDGKGNAHNPTESDGRWTYSALHELEHSTKWNPKGTWTLYLSKPKDGCSAYKKATITFDWDS